MQSEERTGVNMKSWFVMVKSCGFREMTLETRRVAFINGSWKILIQNSYLLYVIAENTVPSSKFTKKKYVTELFRRKNEV
jgi:hypothetical protein